MIVTDELNVLHPCVVSTRYAEDAVRGSYIDITYQHRVVNGRCTVCDDPVVFVHALRRGDAC